MRVYIVLVLLALLTPIVATMFRSEEEWIGESN